MTLSRDAELDSNVKIEMRISILAVSAITEAIEILQGEAENRQVHCWLGLPEPRPGLPSDLHQHVTSTIYSEIGIAPENIHLLPYGHASGLMAMQFASEAVAAGEAEYAIAAGSDSYYEGLTLDWLDDNRRLMSSSNRNGFPPGEAAGACLIVSQLAATQYSWPVLAQVVAAATSEEPNTISGEGLCVGNSLTQVIRRVTSDLDPPQALTKSYCDINGERYRSTEVTYAMLRTQHLFNNAMDYLCPADCWGDIGAASGPVFAALAVYDFRSGHSSGNLPILWAGSDGGQRTAILLRLETTR